MIEGVVLGTIQGITEWLPISSEAILVLAKTKLFNQGESLSELIELALFLHLGTFFAAAWYLRDDVRALAKALLRPHRILREGETERMLRFLVLSTFMSGIIGYFLIEVALPAIEADVEIGTWAITLGVGALLLATALAQFTAKRRGRKGRKDVGALKDEDGLLLGLVQGMSALPGFSRSGLTISALLLRKFDDTAALRLSFLMSLPAVLGGNVFLVAAKEGAALSLAGLVGLGFSFLLGLLTIHVLFRAARRLNFSYFVLAFGLLTIVSAFI